MVDRELDLGIRSIGSIISIAWRRKYIAVCIFIVVLVLATNYIFSLAPRYEATSAVLLSSGTIGQLNESRSRLPGEAPDAILLRSELDILTSDEICRRVIEELNLVSHPEFNKPPGFFASIASWLKNQLPVRQSDGGTGLSVNDLKREGVTRAYKSKLSIANDGKSLVVGVGFTTEDPQLSRQIANTHARVYLEHQVERRASRSSGRGQMA